jgi:branched-chain amino acid transport system substrate-binding protein
MKLSRRDVLIGGAASLAAVSACARAQQSNEIVIGALYPLSGASGASGVDARHALETAADVINTSMDLDLPLAKSAGLAGLGGAKVKVVYPALFISERVSDRAGVPECLRRILTSADGP